MLGGLALVLAATGIYGVLSYLVVQRTGEIGVRMALGASPGEVIRMVLRQSLRLVAAGLAAGAGLAWLASTAIMATPAGERAGGFVNVFEPAAYAASLALIFAMCLLAASVPALRASRIDPIATLRQD